MNTTNHPVVAVVALAPHGGRPAAYLLAEVRKINGRMGVTAEYDATDRLWTVTVPPDDQAAFNAVSSRLEWCADRGAKVTWR